MCGQAGNGKSGTREGKKSVFLSTLPQHSTACDARTLGDMPARLLPLLTDQPQTGDELGLKLGVNRVTINTLARKLQEDGVPLVIGRAGYALPAGTPAAALVQTARPLRYLGTVSSTQDEMRAWAENPRSPAPHGAVVVAERQVAGRGRRGRVWDSNHGTLTFSVLLRGEAQDLSLGTLALLPLAVGVAAQHASQVGGLKWPNDMLTLDRRKLAGILVEADLRGEEARRAIIGIGINVTGAPAGAAHLSEFQPGLTRAEVLGRILRELEHWLTAPAQDILRAWKTVSLTLGQPVRVQTPRGPIEGRATDLDSSGSLLVQTSSGLHTVSAGDVELIGQLESVATPER